MSDEGFHEIQLNGKQLVFLFMSATIVSVVIFLAGVMVGRGVKRPVVESAAAAAEAPVDPTASAPASVSTASSNQDRVPITAQENLTYAERLEAPTPADEPLTDPTKDVKAAPAPAEAPKETPKEPAKQPPVAAVVATKELSPQSPAVESVRFAEPTGGGWVVQVMATKTREEAETVARRLSSKGYPTFITLRDTPAPEKFGIRIGKYNDKRDAEAISTRLTKEEHFKPWVTR